MKASGRHLKIRALLDKQEFVDLETFFGGLRSAEQRQTCSSWESAA